MSASPAQPRGHRHSPYPFPVKFSAAECPVARNAAAEGPGPALSPIPGRGSFWSEGAPWIFLEINFRLETRVPDASLTKRELGGWGWRRRGNSPACRERQPGRAQWLWAPIPGFPSLPSPLLFGKGGRLRITFSQVFLEPLSRQVLKEKGNTAHGTKK